MRLTEFYSIDLAEKAYFELHNDLKNAKLLENSNDYNIYAEFISLEKSYAVPQMKQNNMYYPLYLRATPVANYIKGEYLKNSARYIRHENERIIFSTDAGIDIKFPMDRNMGDGRIDLFIYSSLQDIEQFLSALTLKFNGWNINISPVAT
jgi:hypothetical protein